VALTGRIAPDAAAKTAVHRLRMATAARRLGADRREGAIAAALRVTALNRVPAPERDWAARIERRRADVAGLSGRRTPEETGVFDIALAVRWMSVPPVLGRLLLRLVCELRPRSIFELGTGFGISTAYMAAGLALNGSGRLVSVDLDQRPAAIAAEGLAALELGNVSLMPGEVDPGLAEADPINLAFLDADHREQPTIDALELVQPRLAPAAVIVFDDVGSLWPGMNSAWRRIAARPELRGAHRVGRFGIALAR
jgi:predicted O-methyltransferase YrrM